MINLMIFPGEVKTMLSAYRALNEKYEKEGLMTPAIKDEIITSVIHLEILQQMTEEIYPEPAQINYDKIIN